MWNQSTENHGLQLYLFIENQFKRFVDHFKRLGINNHVFHFNEVLCFSTKHDLRHHIPSTKHSDRAYFFLSGYYKFEAF